MKTKVAIEKGKLLWSISELVGFDANERLDWVRKNQFNDNLFTGTDILKYGQFNNVVNDTLIVPIYMIVKGVVINNNLYPAFKKEEKNIIMSVEFYETLNDTIIALKTAFCSHLSPYLFIYNADKCCFEKNNFKVGQYLKIDDDDTQQLIARDFEYEYGLNADFRYFEDYDMDEIEGKSDIFIEIPDIYEFTYNSECCFGDLLEKDMCVLRNTSSIVDDALSIIADCGAYKVVVDGSFARYIFYPDWEAYRMRMGLEEYEPIEESDFDFYTFSKCVNVKVIYRYNDVSKFLREEELNKFFENRTNQTYCTDCKMDKDADEC